MLTNSSGQDATPEFARIHSPDVVDDLPDASCLGELDPSTATALHVPAPDDGGGDQPPAASNSNSNSNEVVPLPLCVRATDFEAEAKKVLSRRSRIYITSSANSGLSLRGNLDSWSQVTLRPRVLRDMSSVSARSSMLGRPAVVPFFVAPMGTMGMSHADGELALVRGIARRGVHAVVSTASSRTLEAIMAAHEAGVARAGGRAANPSRLFFQLYVPTDRARALVLLRKVKRAGYEGLFVTVDTPRLGKRTEDRRKQAEEALEDGKDHSTTAQPVGDQNSENEFAPAVGARVVPGQISPAVTWEDLEWIRDEWKGPIVLKGIQTAEDARLAAEYDCQGILLSNHGGRQQHTAPSALSTLLEIRTYCPEVLDKMEVYVDGGCRDGADMLKALALGATAVGIGRPFLYAMAAYGSQGVEKLIDSKSQPDPNPDNHLYAAYAKGRASYADGFCFQTNTVLAEELTLGMALLGAASIDQLRPEMVNASALLNNMWRPEIPSITSRL